MLSSVMEVFPIMLRLFIYNPRNARNQYLINKLIVYNCKIAMQDF